MRKPLAFLLNALFANVLALSLQAQFPTAANMPTDRLLSEPGPTFRVDEAQLRQPLTLIVYGDQRFTDPSNKRLTNPRIRQWLVEQVASERPAAILTVGDIPLAGNVANDYAVFHNETRVWRDKHLRMFPVLGNHEFAGNAAQGLENWWTAFPELRNRRWYSAQFGAQVYVLALDSGASLKPGSDQARWIEKQVEGLPASIDFVMVILHHPPVADVQKHIEVDHNPRLNEIALRDYLSKTAPTTRAQFVVAAGHIHNYERAIVDGVTYLVAGGGAAPPYFVERTPEDLYQSELFPNYHYVKFTLEKDALHGVMYRVVNPEAKKLTVEIKDTFDLALKPGVWAAKP